MIEGIVRKENLDPFLLVIIISIFIGIAIVRTIYPKKVQNWSRTLRDPSSSLKIYREEIGISNGLCIILMLTFFIVSSLYISLTINHLKNPFKSINSETFLIIFINSLVILSSYFTLKYITLKLIGWTLNIKQLLQVHLVFNIHISIVTGIVLIIPVSFLLFNKQFESLETLHYSIFSVLILYYIYAIFSTVLSSNQLVLSKFHMILYLCTLEIIPLISIITLLKDGNFELIETIN